MHLDSAVNIWKILSQLNIRNKLAVDGNKFEDLIREENRVPWIRKPRLLYIFQDLNFFLNVLYIILLVGMFNEWLCDLRYSQARSNLVFWARPHVLQRWQSRSQLGPRRSQSYGPTAYIRWLESLKSPLLRSCAHTIDPSVAISDATCDVVSDNG